MRSTCALAVLILSLTACSTLPRSGSRPELRPASHIITDADLRAAPARDLFGAIEGTRPGFLWPRGRGQAPRVYVDGFPSAGTDVLRSIRALDVQDVTYLDPIEATTRYGLDHQGGAILVRTRAPGGGQPSGG